MAERGEPLSERELDVLRRLAVGESNKAIADGLSISPLTVKTHLRNIYTKLDVSTRTEALNTALQQRLITVYDEAEAAETPETVTPPATSLELAENGALPAAATPEETVAPTTDARASTPFAPAPGAAPAHR
ncbi:MAG: response regulator transcription factor, partial [Candidatus Promineofilum sp.]|nr:response regulator transcription factor [Promineifilum sp.]